MPELNSGHIRRIQQDLENSGLKNNLLKHELLDHLCCEVEAEMGKGSSFQQAYGKVASFHTKKELSRTEKNLSFFINYKSIITAGLLYLGIILYLISWLFQFNMADWVGLASFLLISFVFLRYSVIFSSDRKLQGNKLLSVLAGVVFVFFFAGSIFRFLMLSYGLSNPHVMPMLLFSWLILTVMAPIYYRALYNSYKQSKNRIRIKVYLTMSLVHLILALFSFSTLLFPFLQKYIPILAIGIVVVDVVFFITILFIRQKGKVVLKSLLFASFMMVFIFFPLKAMIKPKAYSVQFNVITKQKMNTENLYIHINYFKYGKETLKLERTNDSVFQSKPIMITGGNIEMACKITNERKNTYDVLYNPDIEEKRLKLYRNDTIFTIKYKP